MPAFYLHEDDWGMISLLPVENAAWVEEETRNAARAAEENFAGFTQVGEARIPTYKEVYVISEEKHPIAERAIRLDDLRALLAENWPEAERVESGYSSHVEGLPSAFAFGKAYDSSGAFYGSHKDEVVTRLHILRPDSEEAHAVGAFEDALARVGEEYKLVLADWWIKAVVDLFDPGEVSNYLRGET